MYLSSHLLAFLKKNDNFVTNIKETTILFNINPKNTEL